MTLALVTGGTGFIGRHLVRRLVEHGDSVRCLVRDPNRPDAFAPPIEQVPGDVTLDQGLDEALQDVEVVYHLAGATLPRRSSAYRLINTEGTRRLAAACARQLRPPVFVYVSSLAAAGPARDGVPLTEDSPACPISEYGRSKLAAEQCLRDLAGRLSVTVLRPPAVFGPGDRYGLKLFRLVQSGVNIVPGSHLSRISWIHVADLVDAMVLAARRGLRLAALDAGPADQGTYFVALDEYPTLSEVADLAAHVQGLAIRRTYHVPTFLLWVGCWVNMVRMWILRRPAFLNTDKVREILAGSWICSPLKAKRELGFTCATGLADGFRLTCQWYHQQGWLTPRSV